MGRSCVNCHGHCRESGHELCRSWSSVQVHQFQVVSNEAVETARESLVVGAASPSHPGHLHPAMIVATMPAMSVAIYTQWVANEVTDDVRPRYTAVLLDTLPPGAHLLELGCGGR